MATLTSPLSPTAPSADRPSTRRRNRYTDNVYLQDGLIVIGILSALVFLIVAVSMDAASYVDDMTVLLPVTAGAIILGLLMSFSRFDAFFALSQPLYRAGLDPLPDDPAGKRISDYQHLGARCFTAAGKVLCCLGVVDGLDHRCRDRAGQ